MSIRLWLQFIVTGRNYTEQPYMQNHEVCNTMKVYKNLSKKSGIIAYEYGEDYINIRFNSGELYTYTNEITGQKNINFMKCLAEHGSGLSTFISRYVKNKYVKKTKLNN